MDEKNKVARRAVRAMVTGCLFATLAAASAGCDRPQGHYSSRPSVESKAQEPGEASEVAQAPAPPLGVSGGLDAAAPIRDFATIVGATDRATLLNRPVDLASVEVVKVGSPKLLWIGGSRDEGVPVLVEESSARGSVKGGAIQEGQRLFLLGEVRPVPLAAQMQADWGLSGEDANALARGMIYVQARYVSYGPIADAQRQQIEGAGQAGQAGAQGQPAHAGQVGEGAPQQAVGAPSHHGSPQGQAGRRGEKGLEGQQGAQQRVDPGPSNPSRAYTAPNAEPRGRP